MCCFVVSLWLRRINMEKGTDGKESYFGSFCLRLCL
jgi:hypothetical protein